MAIVQGKVHGDFAPVPDCGSAVCRFKVQGELISFRTFNGYEVEIESSTAARTSNGYEVGIEPSTATKLKSNLNHFVHCIT